MTVAYANVMCSLALSWSMPLTEEPAQAIIVIPSV